MSTLDTALQKAVTSIPECVAAGYVDLSSGMILSMKTVDSHPGEVFDLLARTTSRMLVAACRAADTTRALVVGGVASSTLLRERLIQRVGKLGAGLDIRFGKPEYSADNAAGVALLGMQRFQRQAAAASTADIAGAASLRQDG